MVDVMPTCLEILEVEPNPDVQGFSLLGAVNGSDTVRPYVGILSVFRSERYKLFPGRKELYDLENVPGELVNLYSELPETAARLSRLNIEHLRKLNVAAWEFAKRRNRPKAEVRLSEKEREELRALGYLTE